VPGLALIAAVAENGVIGRDNQLPWHLPGDLAYFKRNTLGKPVVMGRNTFESIGRPLPGRSNIVISRRPGYAPQGVITVSSLDDALALAARVARSDEVEEAVVIGGARVYAESLQRANRLYLTEVHAAVEGDVRFPPVDWSRWREDWRERHAAGGANPYDYSFVIYSRA
tara:strand:- start:3010 stop:3516 length:507 start_codon:yes stop_codon:yes gene_type:complete